MSDNEWDETDEARERMLHAAYEREFNALGIRRPKFHEWTLEDHEKEIAQSISRWNDSGLWDGRNVGKKQDTLEHYSDVFEDYGHIGCKKLLYPPKKASNRKPNSQSKNNPK